jgi:hypothetical protein
MTINAWYGLTKRLSFSAGYAVFSDFVAQDVTAADQSGPGGAAAVPPTSVVPVTGRWNYGGRAQVVTLGSRYAATERVSLTGQVEWVRGHNLISNSTMVFPAAVVTDLGSYSEVLNETTRVSLGADWVIRPRVITYVRYELYNFNDILPGYQTGLAQGVLGGFSAIF